MSLNVLNKKFISLLRQIDLDIDRFHDKSFDGLFESRHDDLNYFLRWFVENISSENVLTEAEVDVCCAFKRSLFGSDEEFEVDVTDCSPSYHELESLNENYVNSLAVELEELNKEFEQLQALNLNLEREESELKKKPNSLRKECSAWKKRLGEIKEEVRVANSSFRSVDDAVGRFRLISGYDSGCMSKLKSTLKEEEDLIRRLSMDEEEGSLSLSSVLLDDRTEGISKLKTRFKTSKFLRIVSKCFLEEARLKVAKAEEILGNVEEEGERAFAFDEVESTCSDLRELDTYEKLRQEVDFTLPDSAAPEVEREWELKWHRFLSRALCRDLRRNEARISEGVRILDRVKSCVSNNMLMVQAMRMSMEKEKECGDLIEGLCLSLEEKSKRIKNAMDSLARKNERFGELSGRMEEKNALSMSYKKMGLGGAETCRENDFLGRALDRVGCLVDDPDFHSESLLNGLERTVSLSLSNVTRGPTSQIRLCPIALLLEFGKCEEFLAELSRSVQRLVTDYMNSKEAAVRSERGRSLLWMDFVMKARAPGDVDADTEAERPE